MSLTSSGSPPALAVLRELMASLSATPSAEAASSAVLERLVTSTGSVAAFLVTDPCGDVRAITSAGYATASMLDEIEEIAARVGLAGEPEVVPGQTAPSHVLVIPMAGGDLSRVLVLLRSAAAGPFLEAQISRVWAAVAELTLRFRAEDAERVLRSRLDEARLAQAQLQAYAHDVRETFTAEKQRAAELAIALAELRQTYLATVQGLAVAVEAKDALTAGHIARVTGYGLALLRVVLPHEVDDPEYEYGFLLHDIGKLSVPDAILGKQGPLTDDEWVIMRLHPESGRRILEGIPFLAKAKDLVFTHHERWDGKGYPRGLGGEDIPVASRLFPIVDSYDAMTSDRPYRKGMPVAEAFREVAAGSGSQFWPDAAAAFLSLTMDDLEAIRNGPHEWSPRRPA